MLRVAYKVEILESFSGDILKLEIQRAVEGAQMESMNTQGYDKWRTIYGPKDMLHAMGSALALIDKDKMNLGVKTCKVNS